MGDVVVGAIQALDMAGRGQLKDGLAESASATATTLVRRVFIGHLNEVQTVAPVGRYFSVSFCTRQFMSSATYKVLASRQAISLTIPNSLNCLPALPKRPTIVPSSSIL